jgi:hypothetical protein
MEFLITEKQLSNLILSEGRKDDLSLSVKKMYSFTKEVVKSVMNTYGINIRMFLTWGTSVGGFMMPLDNFIKTGNFQLTDDQRSLILAGVCFIIFFETKRGLTKIMTKIQEEGLESEFDVVLSKGIELKNAFQQFIDATVSSTGIVLEIIAYSFLIPIITDIFELANNSANIQETALIITERLLASGVSLGGKESLLVMVKKLLKRFR